MNGGTLQRVDGNFFHQRLELFREGRLAAARGPEQIQDLLAFLQALRRVLEEGDDLLDRVFHSVEVAEGRIDPDDLVEEQSGQARIVVGVHQFGLSDCGKHAFGSSRVGSRILLADLQVLPGCCIPLPCVLRSAWRSGQKCPYLTPVRVPRPRRGQFDSPKTFAAILRSTTPPPPRLGGVAMLRSLYFIIVK